MKRYAVYEILSIDILHMPYVQSGVDVLAILSGIIQPEIFSLSFSTAVIHIEMQIPRWLKMNSDGPFWNSPIGVDPRI
jgi:hypothetical protein